MLYVVAATVLLAVVCAVGFARCAYLLRRTRRGLAEDATFATLHATAQLAPVFRSGLRREPARKAVRHLQTLLGTPAVALVDDRDLLAWHGACTSHAVRIRELAAPALRDGRTCVVDHLACDDPRCTVSSAVVAPLVIDRRTPGAILALGPGPSTRLVEAAGEVATWASAQLELAELDRLRSRLADAELKALRSQISPHFIYNCLTTIASFVRTDPERARRLLLDFAGFTRYALRGSRQFTTLDEELKSIDRYVALERARFGERLQFSLRIAPEVLSIQVPFLCLQPLVENAIRHGVEGKPGVGHVTVTARDSGAEAQLSVEDDGVGMDPGQAQAVLAGVAASGRGIGLANVDERLRNMFGDVYGVVIDTGPGMGTKVSLRIPKFRPLVAE
jgi:two-component system, LytTR family, sensor kinase